MLATNATTALAHASSPHRCGGTHARRKRTENRERYARADGDGRAGERQPDAATDDQRHRAKSCARTEQAGRHAQHRCLRGCCDQQVPARGATRSQQSQVATITLDGSERGQIGQAERDERPWNGQHDVQRLGVKGITSRCVQLV